MSESLSASYKWVQQQEAWGDLSRFLDKLITDSNRDLDVMAVEHLSATVAAHGRGMRDAVAKIRAHIDYQTVGGPK
jgi:hypothetical protein